ncbi:MAG: hypothetical protein ABIP44_01565 [Pseudoxanthomonas sp.]
MLSISSLIFSAFAAASPQQASHLSIAPCKVGDRQQFETTTCDIELKNDGDSPIHISNAEAGFAWDKIEVATVVPPHATAYLKATIALQDSYGYIKRSFRFDTSEPGKLAARGASVFAFVSSVLDQQTSLLDFGAVKLSGEMPTKSIKLTSREVPAFRLLEVTAAPAYLNARIDPDGQTVRVTVLKDAPWGLQHEKIKVKTNAPQQSEVWISVDINAIGDVAPDGNPFSFGLMRNNNKNEFLLRLTSESGKAFKVGELKLDRVKGEVESVPCVPASMGCRMLRITVANDQPQGRLQGSLSIQLPDFKRTLPIELVGMLLTPEYKVHDLSDELEKSGAAKSAAPATSSAQAPELDLKNAIKQTINEDQSGPPPGTGPLMRWSVANESSVHGYIIYRAEAEEGPFLRVNKTLIKAVNEDGAGTGSYQWRDNTAVSGKAYWYSIGMVKGTGEKVPLTGAQKVVAK